MPPVLLALLASAAGSVQDPGAAAPRGVEIDRVVAVVRSSGAEPRVITLTRLEEETRIALIRAARCWPPRSPWTTRPSARGSRPAGRDAPRRRGGAPPGVRVGPQRSRRRAGAGLPGALREPGRLRGLPPRWDLTDGGVEAILAAHGCASAVPREPVAHAAMVPRARSRPGLTQHAAEIGARDREVARAQPAAGARARPRSRRWCETCARGRRSASSSTCPLAARAAAAR